MNIDMHNVIRAPQFSEKGTRIADKNKHIVFIVNPKANKPQIKEAVEKLFNVKVDSVQVLNMKGKDKRFGRFNGKRKGWKKAFVQLKEGFDISFASQAETA